MKRLRELSERDERVEKRKTYVGDVIFPFKRCNILECLPSHFRVAKRRAKKK